MFFPFYVVEETGWRQSVCRRVSKISILFVVRLLERGVPICCPFLTPLHHDLLPVDSHCLSPFAVSPWSLECQETVLCPQDPAGPSLYNICPGDPSSHSPSAFTWVFPFAWTALPSFFYLFVTSSTVSPLENLHWPLPPIHKESGIFPSLCPPQL